MNYRITLHRKLISGVLFIFIISMFMQMNRVVSDVHGQTDEIRTLYTLDTPPFVESELADEEVKEVGLAFFLTVLTEEDIPLTESQFIELVDQLIEEANTAFEQCDVAFVLETAQIIAVPDELLTVQTGEPGSSGGHPPHDVTDLKQWLYDEDSRLTDDLRLLFAYARDYVSTHTIAVFGVNEIEYYVGEEQVTAIGQSFPANNYHHEEDYPLRNSVLVTPVLHPDAEELDYMIMAGIASHELAHMLLNDSTHPADYAEQQYDTIMGVGNDPAEIQCEMIRDNIDLFYRDGALIDPGQPSS